MTSMNQTTDDTVDSDTMTGDEDTETGSMSVDTAALGGGAIADAGEDSQSVTDADGGAR